MTPPSIDWRIRLASPPARVWQAWTTDEGRARFWGETSRTIEGGFELGFINGEVLQVEVLEALPMKRLAFRYFGGSTVTVELAPGEGGGCDLRLRETDAPEPVENYAGWVSVLLACKASVDFGVDLRSHDPRRSWDQGYVDV